MPALDGDRAAAEAGPRAAGDEGDAVVVGEPDDARHFLGGRGEHDGLGEPAVDGAVELEDQHVLGGVEDVLVAHDPLEDVDQGLVVRGSSHGVMVGESHR